MRRLLTNSLTHMAHAQIYGFVIKYCLCTEYCVCVCVCVCTCVCVEKEYNAMPAAIMPA